MGYRKEYPKISGFEFHGVEFHDVAGSQLLGKCIFCGKKKFYVNHDSRLWDCKVCGENGNFEAFLMAVHLRNKEDATLPAIKALGKHRGLKVPTLRAFEIGYSKHSDEYTFPLYTCNKNGKQEMADIPRYNPSTKRCFATKGAAMGLIIPRHIHNSDTVWICEGEWDTMVMYEILKSHGIKEDVIGVRGASNLPKKWLPFFSKKDVNLLYDNDTAGQKGMIKAWEALSTYTSRIKCLAWPSHDFPDKFDLRDLYQKTFESKPKKTYKAILGMLSNTPPEGSNINAVVAVGFDTFEVDSKEQHEIDTKGKGMSRGSVVKAYRKWLHLPNAEVLDILYGSVFANRITADPLWMFLIAPPGGSKSELLMTLSAAPLTYCTTSLTPKALISGANFAGGGDPSMIQRIIGKTLVIKDFTTILTMNSVCRDEIFGILRDAYDGSIEKEFGNGIIRRYEGQFGLVAGVTPVIDDTSISSSVLGERFLKYRIKTRGKINVAKDVILRALSNLCVEDEMRHELKDVARRVLNRPVDDQPLPKVNREHMEKLVDLAQYTAVMRGCVSRERYSRQLTLKPVTEHGTRLAKQLATLGLGIAIFQGKTVVDDGVFKLLTQVARDTAPDRVEEVVKQLYSHRHDEYASASEISLWSKFPQDTVRSIMEDLTLLNITVCKRDGMMQYKLADAMVAKLDRIGMYKYERNWKKSLTEDMPVVEKPVIKKKAKKKAKKKTSKKVVKKVTKKLRRKND